MPKKKEETTMLVRAVPLDVSERVQRYCRREGIRYREFLERAIDLFEGSNRDDGQERADGERVQDQVNPIQRVAAIADTVKAYKNAIRLQKDLIAIRKDINLLADWEDRPHIYLEVVRMTRELDEIIKKYVPKHEIPDDPQAMAAMGLPNELIYKDLTHEEWEERKKRNEEVAKKWGISPDSEESSKTLEEIRREMEEAERAKSSEQPAETLTGQEQVQPESKTASAEPSQDAEKHEEEHEPGQKEIKTARFGRGFDDWVKGKGGDGDE
jgi:hypothetical protein